MPRRQTSRSPRPGRVHPRPSPQPAVALRELSMRPGSFLLSSVHCRLLFCREWVLSCRVRFPRAREGRVCFSIRPSFHPGEPRLVPAHCSPVGCGGSAVCAVCASTPPRGGPSWECPCPAGSLPPNAVRATRAGVFAPLSFKRVCNVVAAVSLTGVTERVRHLENVRAHARTCGSVCASVSVRVRAFPISDGQWCLSGTASVAPEGTDAVPSALGLSARCAGPAGPRPVFPGAGALGFPCCSWPAASAVCGCRAEAPRTRRSAQREFTSSRSEARSPDRGTRRAPPAEACAPGVWTAILSLRPRRSRLCVSVSWSLLTRTPVTWPPGHAGPRSNLTPRLKARSPHAGTFGGPGVRASEHEFGGTPLGPSSLQFSLQVYQSYRSLI